MFACITPALAFGSAAERTPVRIKKTLIFIIPYSYSIKNFTKKNRF
jgi:ammonia channel protein AmtB